MNEYPKLQITIKLERDIIKKVYPSCFDKNGQGSYDRIQCGQLIENAISKDFNIDCVIDHSSSRLYIDIIINEKINKNLTQLYDEVVMFIHDLFNIDDQIDINSPQHVVIEYPIPENIKFSFEYISIEPEENMSLHNIHKNILSCSNISFCREERITDSVLGLLKIKDLEIIENLFGRQKQKWLQTICNHLKDKDIVQCAEELIENNLKEYAKL